MRVSQVVLVLGGVSAQHVGSYVQEGHPKMGINKCTSTGCQPESGEVTLDANWRWIHTTEPQQYTNCYTGTEWDPTLCPDPASCTQNCALEGVDTPSYLSTYGVSSDGSTLKLGYVTDSNVGSRTYLMESESAYKMFQLKNQEFSFEIDMSTLPCGLNGAMYLVEMPVDGGSSKFPTNQAGAKYGTGYCDGQCPKDIKFINGQANSLDYKEGLGHYGSCCNEMDIWEANQFASAYTPHVCTEDGRFRCEGETCGDPDRYGGVCDRDGCDFNSWRVGDTKFMGPGAGFVVDTTKKFTVTTQFITSNQQSSGDLVEIRRLYTQGGKTVQNSNATIPGLSGNYDSVTEGFCKDQKALFNNTDDFNKKGGLKAMGESLERGMVLVMSVWDDASARMLWLDSSFPTDAPSNQPGVTRGPCGTDTGVPAETRSKYPGAYVTYGNIKYGDIGTTLQ